MRTLGDGWTMNDPLEEHLPFSVTQRYAVAFTFPEGLRAAQTYIPPSEWSIFSTRSLNKIKEFEQHLGKASLKVDEIY